MWLAYSQIFQFLKHYLSIEIECPRILLTKKKYNTFSSAQDSTPNIGKLNWYFTECAVSPTIFVLLLNHLMTRKQFGFLLIFSQQFTGNYAALKIKWHIPQNSYIVDQCVLGKMFDIAMYFLGTFVDVSSCYGAKRPESTYS